MLKARLCYAKLDKVRFTSHRDMVRILERALRRAKIPVAYSQGFSPRPRLSLGYGLPTGYESEAEYADIVLDLEPEIEIEEPEIEIERPKQAKPHIIKALENQFLEALPNSLPTGIDIRGVVIYKKADELSLQESITGCEWEVKLAGVKIPKVWAEDVLSSTEIIIQNKTKEPTDIKPAILSLSASDSAFNMKLLTKPTYFRPTDLLSAKGLGLTQNFETPPRVKRIKQWIDFNGDLTDPIQALSKSKFSKGLNNDKHKEFAEESAK